jgi:hypothetical protein
MFGSTTKALTPTDYKVKRYKSREGERLKCGVGYP